MCMHFNFNFIKRKFQDVINFVGFVIQAKSTTTMLKILIMILTCVGPAKQAT